MKTTEDRILDELRSMNKPQPAQDILFDAYEQWRLHPITHEFLKILERHRQSFVDQAVFSVGDFPKLQTAVCGIRDIDTIIKFMTDYNLFKQKVN
jgi:hypothetical protein